MSDPVTNVQIEDVLSSIRKLVSEEVRAQTRHGTAPAPEPSVDKLVLTPALRVPDDVDDKTPTPTAQKAADAEVIEAEEEDRDEAHAGEFRLDDDFADDDFDDDFVEDGFDEDEFDDEDSDFGGDILKLTTGNDQDFDLTAFSRTHLEDEDGSDAPVEGSNGEVEFFRAISSEAPARASEETEPQSFEEDYEDEGENAASTLPAEFDDRPDDVGLTDDEFDDENPDGLSAFDDIVGDYGLSVEATDISPQSEPAAELQDDDLDTGEAKATTAKAAWTFDGVPPEPRAVGSIPSFLRSRGVASLEDRIAGLEDVVGATGSEFEPDDMTPDDNAPETVATKAEEALPWEDHLDEFASDSLQDDEPELEEDIEAADYAFDAEDDHQDQDQDSDAVEMPAVAPASTPKDDAALLADEAPMIDEETLRDLVSEIVRQELQGALGERITRNVRKLVRREIQRALTAHDLL